MLASRHDAVGAVEQPRRKKDSDSDSGVVTFAAGDESVDVRTGRRGGRDDAVRASLNLAFRNNTYERYRNRFARKDTFEDDVFSQLDNRRGRNSCTRLRPSRFPS